MRVACLVRALLIAISLIPPGLLADSAWTIPGIVNAPGLNGTHFVSDLTVTDPGGSPANVTLSFFPSGSSPKALALAPGQTVVYSDVAGGLFGSPGTAGAVSVVSDQPLLIRAKTYNTASSGTYGVALPVVASDRLLAPGDVADSLWVSQDPSSSAGYRTNVALVFPDASGGAATVTMFDADGNARGGKDFSLDAAGVQQFSVSSFAGAVPVGRAEVAVTTRACRRICGRRRQRHGRRLPLRVRGPAGGHPGRRRERRRADERKERISSSGRTGASTTRRTRTRRSKSRSTRAAARTRRPRRPRSFFPRGRSATSSTSSTRCSRFPSAPRAR